MIYSVTPDSGPSQLSVVIDTTSTTNTASRRWHMRIYQYECTSPVLGKILIWIVFQNILEIHNCSVFQTVLKKQCPFPAKLLNRVIIIIWKNTVIVCWIEKK